MIPLVSIVSTVYNQESFLADMISSVLAQTYPHFQLIIIDDGSTDQTEAIARSFSDPRIEYYRLPENGHIAAATNFGLRKIRGAYMAVIDGDDQWKPEKLEKQVRFMEEHPEYNVCFTWVDLIDENGNLANERDLELQKHFQAHTWTMDEHIRQMYFHGCRLNNPSSMIRSDIIPKVGEHNLFYVQAPDLEWWARLAQIGSFAVIEEPLTNYRHVFSSNYNSSSRSTETETRFFTEYMLILFHLIKNMKPDLFISSFKEYFKSPDSHTPDELLCEKAFLLSTVPNGTGKTNPFGLLLLEQLLGSPDTALLLKEKYHFSTLQCRNLTTVHYFNDWYLQNEQNRLNQELSQAAYLNNQMQTEIHGNRAYIHNLEEASHAQQAYIDNLTATSASQQAYVSNLEHDLRSRQSYIDGLAAQIRELNERLAVSEAQAVEALRHADVLDSELHASVQELELLKNSTSWKLTKPLRTLKHKK